VGRVKDDESNREENNKFKLTSMGRVKKNGRQKLKKITANSFWKVLLFIQ
jgi:hypothetical protein